MIISLSFYFIGSNQRQPLLDRVQGVFEKHIVLSTYKMRKTISKMENNKFVAIIGCEEPNSILKQLYKVENDI